MCARPTEQHAEKPAPLRGWRHIIAGQAVVTVLMLPMLSVRPGLSLAATAFNVLALAKTARIYRTRVRNAGHVSATTGGDLATVAACVVGSALWAVVLTLWPLG